MAIPLASDRHAINGVGNLLVGYNEVTDSPARH